MTNHLEHQYGSGYAGVERLGLALHRDSYAVLRRLMCGFARTFGFTADDYGDGQSKVGLPACCPAHVSQIDIQIHRSDESSDLEPIH